MVRMVIADDELYIRQGLLTIPWNEYGIEVAGAASNGEEALLLSKRAHPQILLTDIRMPGMDGLKLIEAVKAEFPQIRTILLTGYQDFDYARSAIKLGAMGYVLKPSDPDEIVDIVLKAKNQVEAEASERLEKSLMHRKVDDAQAAVLKSFVQDLIFGRIRDIESIPGKCRELNCVLNSCVVMVAQLGPDAGEAGSGTLVKIREEILAAASSFYESLIVDIQRSAFCIISKVAPCENDVKGRMLALAACIAENLENKFGVCVSIGISRLCKSEADLHLAYNQAANCLLIGIPSGRSAIVHVEDMKDSLQISKVISSVLEYIEKFYMEEITLYTVSEYVHMNHIYISRLIKKETGETFLDILTKTRMKKACELLRDNSLKTYEVSYRVGIKDAGYFSQVFRKYFGVTPSEYRESLYSKFRDGKGDQP